MVTKNNIIEAKAGLLPDKWQEKDLGSVGIFSKGKGISRADSMSGDLPCVRYGEIYTHHHEYIRRFYSYINEEVARSSSRIKHGDILFAGSGETKEEIGKCVAFLDDCEAYAGGDIVILSPNGVDSMFLGYLLNSENIQKQKSSKGQGDAVVHIHASHLSKIRILLPQLPEQKAIAEVLSDTDNMIQSLEKQIAKKRLIKQGAMQKLLIPKEGWEEKKLSELFTVTRGYVLSMKEIQATEDSEYKYPVFSSQTKNNGLMGYYKDYLYKDSITWTTDGANAGDVKFRKGRFYCTNVCGVLISNKGYANTCVAEAFNRVSKKYVSYVGNPKLMNNVVKDIELALPKEIDEQLYISQVIEDMEEEVLSLEKRLLKLKALKKGLMQNLLTGKIRLKLS